MKLKFILVGGIPVPIAVDEPRHVDQEQLFAATEGKQEIREPKLKERMKDDK